MMENDGLVFAYLLDGKGGGEGIDWEKLRQWSPEWGMVWVHLDYASEKVKKWLAGESRLSPIIGEALLEEETRPRVVSSNEGVLLILRGVNCNPGADPEDMVSIRIRISIEFISGKSLNVRLVSLKTSTLPATAPRLHTKN